MVLSRLIFCFFGQNESQRMYKRVKVGLRYTVVKNLIKTLTHRQLMICSEYKLDDEVEFITRTFCNNCFPKDIVLSLGIKFLTSVKLSMIKSRGAQYISGYLGVVILVIDLPTRSLLEYVGAIFLSTCVWFSARGLF